MLRPHRRSLERSPFVCSWSENCCLQVHKRHVLDAFAETDPVDKRDHSSRSPSAFRALTGGTDLKTGVCGLTPYLMPWMCHMCCWMNKLAMNPVLPRSRGIGSSLRPRRMRTCAKTWSTAQTAKAWATWQSQLWTNTEQVDKIAIANERLSGYFRSVSELDVRSGRGKGSTSLKLEKSETLEAYRKEVTRRANGVSAPSSRAPSPPTRPIYHCNVMTLAISHLSPSYLPSATPLQRLQTGGLTGRTRGAP